MRGGKSQPGQRVKPRVSKGKLLLTHFTHAEVTVRSKNKSSEDYGTMAEQGWSGCS